MDEWTCKGATISDKTARTEFGLTQSEIVAAIRAGKLRYRQGSMHGNPWLRLLRSEVEALVASRHGSAHLRQQKVKAEVTGIDRELRSLRRRIAELEKRRAGLVRSA